MFLTASAMMRRNETERRSRPTDAPDTGPPRAPWPWDASLGGDRGRVHSTGGGMETSSVVSSRLPGPKAPCLRCRARGAGFTGEERRRKEVGGRQTRPWEAHAQPGRDPCPAGPTSPSASRRPCRLHHLPAEHPQEPPCSPHTPMSLTPTAPTASPTRHRWVTGRLALLRNTLTPAQHGSRSP